MSLAQGESVSMETTSQPDEETQKVARFFHPTKKIFSILNYNELAYESDKPMFSIIARYESNQESTSFSINDAKYDTVNIINISTTFKNHEYRDGSNKPVI